MKRLRLRLLVLLVPLVAFGRAAETRLVLVREGASPYTICLAPDASPAERRAGDELQRFVFEMSGARLPIVAGSGLPPRDRVFVGDSPGVRALGIEVPASLGSEGFVLRSAGSDLVIAGGKPRGTLYGVYGLLDSLGCRWFTRDVSRIPKKRTIVLGAMNRAEKPAFEYREPFFTEAFDRDWAARNRINGAHMELDASTGGRVEYFPFVHTFYGILPPDKYFKDHPEYYSLINGSRQAERGQLCLSNPDVLRKSVEVVRGWMREHPEATLFSVSQNDWEGWCECERCRKVEEEEGGAHSGPILRFVNALAAEIAPEHPDKLIDTLAYWYSEAPPLRARPGPNVRIRLCPINACQAHPYEQCPYDAGFIENLRGWSRITNQLYVWHYVTNFSHYLLPFPDLDEIAADIPMYRRSGVVGIFLEGAYPKGGGGESAELRSYVMARLLWNPAANASEAAGEFLEACYGKAAPFMRGYYDLLHDEVRLPPRGAGQHIWIRRSPELSEAVLVRAKELFRQADAAAEDDATRARVRKARLSLDYYELLRDRTYVSRGGRYGPARPEGLEGRCRQLFSELRRFGVTSIHEGVDLERDELQLAASIRAYPIEVLESPALRVEVVPELNARVIRVIDHRTGSDVVRPADFGGQSPGLAVALYPEIGGRAPIDARWAVEARSGPAELVLRAIAAGGLRLRRTFRLSPDEAELGVESVVQNPGPAPAKMALQARLDVNAGPDADARVTLAYRSAAGESFRKSLLVPGNYSGGNETYVAGSLPDGEWRVTLGGFRLSVVNRFAAEEVGRCVASWRARGENRAALGVWSRERVLAPGGSARFATSYRIER